MPEVFGVKFELSQPSEPPKEVPTAPVESADVGQQQQQADPTSIESQQAQGDAQPKEVYQPPREIDILFEDDFFRDFSTAYVSGEEDKAYELLKSEITRLEEAKKDYDSMGVEDIIALKVKKEFPDLSGKALEKAIDRYKKANFGDMELDEYDEDFDTNKSLLESTMNKHAQKLREEFKSEQGKFKNKRVDEVRQKVEKLQAEKQQSAAEAQKEWEQRVFSQEVVDKTIKSGALEVGKSENPVQYKIQDLDKYKKALVSDGDFFNLFATGDEKSPVDFDKWARVVAYAMDPKSFEAAILSAGSSTAKESLLDELQNPAKPKPSSPASPSSFAEALMASIKKR